MDVLAALFFLAAATGIALVVTGLVRARRGSGGPVHDRYEAAFLNGGPARVVDTALTALHADGRIAVGGPGVLAVVRPTAHDPVERAVLQEHAAAPHGALHHLRLAVMRHPAVQETGDGLAARGLLVAPAARRRVLRRCAVLGVTAFLLVPVAMVLTAVDLAVSDGPSVPFVLKVAPALVAAGVTAVVCGSLAGRLTPAGRRAVSTYGRDHAHLPDAGLPVALHGPRALPDPVLREQILAAARFHGPARRPGRGGRRRTAHPGSSSGDGLAAAVVWCAGNSACGGGGSACSGGGGGGSCSSGSCSGGGSGCGGGSSCGSSGSSSCGSSGSCGSSSSSSCSSSSG